MQNALLWYCAAFGPIHTNFNYSFYMDWTAYTFTFYALKNNTIWILKQFRAYFSVLLKGKPWPVISNKWMLRKHNQNVALSCLVLYVAFSLVCIKKFFDNSHDFFLIMSFNKG